MPVFVDTGEKKSAKTSLGAGLRRTSPESIRARQQAQDYRKEGAPRVPRTAALKTLKRAFPALGLKSAKRALIDQLFASSKPADWSDVGGIGPVVWPSNAHLARVLGMSPKTVCQHLRDLAELGLITYRDGPTCRRHGKRDENGGVVEACGIDLSPIAMRIDELTELAEAHEWEAREMKRLRSRRTVIDKHIRSMIDSARKRDLDADTHGAFSHALARRDVIRERAPKDVDGLDAQVADLEALYDHLEGLYDKALERQDVSFEVPENEYRGTRKRVAHTTTAPTFNSGICRKNGIAHTGNTESDEAAYSSMAFEEKPGADDTENKQSTVETDRHTDDLATQPKVEINEDHTRADGLDFAAADNDILQLSIGLVRDACPVINKATPGALDNWQALRESGNALCASANINPQVFHEASNTLGPDIAIAATAVTVQKANQGDVLNPGAYLRTLTKRGRAGQLRIARSLHGLADRNATEQAETRPGETDGQHAIGVDNRHHRKQSSRHRAARPATPKSDAAPRGATPQKGDPHGHGRPLPEPAQAFPQSGSIHFSNWAETVRQNAPEPIPDVDRVAEAFRQFCRRKTIDMTSTHIVAAFKTFCRKWQERE